MTNKSSEAEFTKNFLKSEENKTSVNSGINDTEQLLRREGIIDNEQFETIYLAEDEIEKFLEKYMLENPGVEIETRFVNHPPVQVTQDIEVRWLRPDTPEIPPIIIKEVDYVAQEEPPLKIIQKQKIVEETSEPIIIREKPNIIKIDEPKVIYVSNANRAGPSNSASMSKSSTKEIKIEHVRSDSVLNKSESFNKSRLEFDDQIKKDKTLLRDNPNYSFEEHASIIDYEEEFEHHQSTIEESFDDNLRYKSKQLGNRRRTLAEDRELKYYEEKLKQTLYEEYLLKLEREKIERRLSEQGVFEERLKEKSMSQERLSQLRMSQERLNRMSQEKLSQSQHRMSQNRMSSQSRSSQFRVNEEEMMKQKAREDQLLDKIYKEKALLEQQLRDQRLRHNGSRERIVQSNNTTTNNSSVTGLNKLKSEETSSYKSIKFSKVTDENELKRFNDILDNSSSMQQEATTSTFSSNIEQNSSNGRNYYYNQNVKIY